MNAVARFTTSLTDHVALLLVAMPIVGALLVRLMSRSGREPVCFTALTNVWLCCGLAALAVLQMEPRQDFESLFHPRMLTSLPWPGVTDTAISGSEASSPALPPSNDSASVSRPATAALPQFLQPRISVAINGLNLWLVVLTVAASTAAVRGMDTTRPFLSERLSWLLLTEAALIGTLVAQDVILLAGFNMLSILGLFFLIGYSGRPQRRAAARRFFRVQTAGALLLGLGLVGAAVSHWWMTLAAEVAIPVSFSLNQIVAQVPDLAMTTETGHAYWNTVSSWLLLLTGGASVLRIPLPPLHHWWLDTLEQSDRGTSCLMACGFLPAGLYVAARIVGPLFPEQCAAMIPYLLAWALPAATLLALSGLKLIADRSAVGSPPRSARLKAPYRTSRLIGVSLAICLSLAFAAILTTEPLAIRGGLLMTVSGAAAAGLAFWLLPDSGNCSPARHAGPASAHAPAPPHPPAPHPGSPGRFRSGLVWFSICGLVAAPLSGTFWGLLLIAHSFSRHSALLTLLLLLAITIFAGAVVCAGKHPSTGPHTRVPPGTSPAPDRNDPGSVGMLPLTAVLIAGALFPTHICGPPPRLTPASPPAESESTGTDAASGASEAGNLNTASRSDTTRTASDRAEDRSKKRNP